MILDRCRCARPLRTAAHRPNFQYRAPLRTTRAPLRTNLRTKAAHHAHRVPIGTRAVRSARRHPTPRADVPIGTCDGDPIVQALLMKLSDSHDRGVDCCAVIDRGE